MLEPEDAMKWWDIRPDPATFAFTQGDQIVAFAETHRMKVRRHTLVWGWSNPAWLLEGHFTPAQLSALLQEHIQKVVTHLSWTGLCLGRHQRSLRRAWQPQRLYLVQPPWHRSRRGRNRVCGTGLPVGARRRSRSA